MDETEKENLRKAIVEEAFELAGEMEGCALNLRDYHDFKLVALAIDNLLARGTNLKQDCYKYRRVQSVIRD